MPGSLNRDAAPQARVANLGPGAAGRAQRLFFAGLFVLIVGVFAALWLLPLAGPRLFSDYDTNDTLQIVLYLASVLPLTVVTLAAMLLTFRRRAGGPALAALRAAGVAGEARVLELWDPGLSVNRTPVVGLLLEVHLPGRAPYAVRTETLVSQLMLPQVQPGAVLRVHADPDDPLKVALDLAASF